MIGRACVTKLTLLLVLATGCVARDAGYQDVRRLVIDRTGRDVRWQALEGRSHADRTVRRLLARPLTDQSAVQIALLADPGLQASFEELGIARARLVHALRLPNPEADVALRFHPHDERPEWDLSVTEDIVQLFLIPARSGVAQAELSAAKLAVGGAVLDVVFDVRRAFYAHQTAGQVLGLRRTVLTAARASWEAAKRLSEAGNITDLDLASEQALYEDARLATAQAETARATTRERLASLMGVWGKDAGFKIAGRLADPPESEIDVALAERRSIERSVDLALARARFDAAGRRAGLARAEGWLPRLAAGVGAEREAHWEIGPVVGVELPLLYQGQGMSGAAEAEQRREEKSFGAIAVRLRAAVRSASSRLLEARERARHYKAVVLPLRERIVRETLLEYNAMSAGVFQLLQAKRDQVDTARAYIETLRDYWTARTDLEQLLAGRLGDLAAGLAVPERGADEAASGGARARH